jgi:hypothetical protein
MVSMSASQFKANAKLRRFAVPAPPQVKRRACLLFSLLLDTLVSVVFHFLAGVLAKFIRAYRCET